MSYPKIFIMAFNAKLPKPLYYEFTLEVNEKNIAKFIKAFLRNEINYKLFD